MSEITFVSYDADTIISEMVSAYEAETEESLYPGDERKIFLLNLAAVITNLYSKVNDIGRQTLLRYARSEVLDAIGEMRNVTRLAASYASVTMKFNFSTGHLGSTIPAGTRVSPDGTLFFKTLTAVSVVAGTTSVQVSAQATETGEDYNGFAAGQIAILVDTNIAYCSSVANVDTSSGGADEEADGSTDYPYSDYRARILLAPASYSTAGPSGAYEYYAKSANANIGDVNVTSLSACSVTITILMDDGTAPSAAVLSAVEEAVTAKTVRPLTDNVTVQAAELINYSITFSYWIKASDVLNQSTIQTAVEGAVADYVVWQRQELGQLINPDELRRRVLDAGAYVVTLTSPTQTALESDQAAHLNGSASITYAGTI